MSNALAISTREHVAAQHALWSGMETPAAETVTGLRTLIADDQPASWRRCNCPKGYGHQTHRRRLGDSQTK
jgi:hypothetical protein